MSHRLSRVALSMAGALLLATAVLIAWAIGGDPQPLFTDNITATGTSVAVTVMEQALLDRINGATSSIDVAIYGFNRVSVRDALIAAHNRGVTVRVVADDHAYADSQYAPHYAALAGAGIPIVLDNRSSLMHNKIFIIDGQQLWTGSTNMTDTGFTYNHNNTLVFTSTVLADIFTTEFEEMYIDRRFGTAKTDNTVHLIDYNGIPVEIYFSPSDGAMAELIAEVSAAQESIYFSIFYFTDDALRDALIERLQNGVTMAGIWDRLGAGNQYSEDEALCAAGVPIKREDFGGKMHHKFMVIDANGSNPRVVTGSMNWTASGGDANDENTLIIHDGVTAVSYQAEFQKLWDALGDHTLCQLGSSYFLFSPAIVSGAPPPPGVADVQLVYIEYNPDGDDVAGEYVQLSNLGGAAQLMTGWTLHDAGSHVFTFPAFSLPAGATVRVWTKAGADTATDLYWGSGVPIWNNTGDTATLHDHLGQVVDVCSYTGGGVGATCP